MVVYKITNQINGKIYVGQTSFSIEKRWREHVVSKKSLISKAVRKYGEESFSIECLEKCSSVEELNQKEIHYIALLKSTQRDVGYNVEFGGLHSPMTNETKQKLSIAHQGKKLSKEHKDRIGLSCSGKKRSEETKTLMSQSFKGRTHSEETRKKISEATTGRVAHNQGVAQSEETKLKLSQSKNSIKIKVLCIDNGTIYESISAAARSLNVSKRAIQLVLRGKNKTVKGLSLAMI